MLHPVKPPHGVIYLKSLVEIQFKVLSLACSENSEELLNDEEKLKEEFGEKWGKWLYERINSSKNFGDAINALIKAIDWKGDKDKATSHREHILNSFKNDTSYNEKISSPDGFSFSYPKLNAVIDADTLKCLRNLMEMFYNYIFYSGFPKIDDDNTKYKSADFVKDFWTANAHLNVCPACDSHKPSSSEGKVMSENDHFLPKSIYPFLSVHPSNLLPTCKVCNQSFKKDKNPIDDYDNTPLSRSFFPFEFPAFGKDDGSENERIRIEVLRTPLNEKEVNITATDVLDNHRVANINNLLKLESQWKDQIPSVISGLLEILRKQIERNDDYLNEIGDDKFFCKELEIEKRSSQRRIGAELYSILKTSYLTFALTELEEREHLRFEIGKPH